MKLTDSAIRTLEPPAKGARLVFDAHRDAPPGFAVKITSAGTVTFVLRYTASDTGQRRVLTVGHWPAWTVVAAREKGAEHRRRIDAGIDPLAERASRRADPTFAEAVEEYAAVRLSQLKSGAKVHRCLVRDAVPVIGRLKMKDIRRRDIIRMVESRADKPRTAGMLLAYVKTMMGWCADREMIDIDPAAGVRGSRIHADIRQRARARVLDDAEIRTLWLNAETCGMHRLTALALKMVLLTGQRPGEVCGMQWAEVDRDARTWTVPAARRGKTNDTHTVPLCRTALKLLDDAQEKVEKLTPRRKVEPSGFVFETRPGAPIDRGSANRAVARYRAELGNRELPELGHWVPHDLRRTCRTRLAEIGVTPDIAELTIGHVKRGIVATYDRHAYRQQIRMALESWERRLLAIVHGEQPDNVVELRRK